MFDAATSASIRAALSNALALLATPAVWTQAKPPHATKNIEVGIKTASARDEAIISAYGVGALIFTFKASDFSTPPEQFDQITVGGETYVLAAVHPARVGNIIQMFKGYVRGKVHV
jgi:hypothetical protein